MVEAIGLCEIKILDSMAPIHFPFFQSQYMLDSMAPSTVGEQPSLSLLKKQSAVPVGAGSTATTNRSSAASRTAAESQDLYFLPDTYA